MKLTSPMCYVVLSGAISLSTAAVAAPTVYTDRATFDAEVGPSTAYDFAQFAGAAGEDVTSPYSEGGVTFSSELGSMRKFDDAYGQPYLADDFDGAFTVSISSGSVGLYLGDFFGEQTVTYTFGSLSGVLTIPHADDTTFFGFSNGGAAATVTFSNINEIDVPHFVIAGASSAVPEPATWAMMIGGIGIAGGALRRRRSVTTTVRFA